MEIGFAKKFKNFETGIFSVLKEKKEELIKEGKEVYDFSVGTPDFHPQDYIMKAMQQACEDPELYKYSLGDMNELLESVSRFYKRRFGVDVKKEQIMSLYGSQEGMAHFALTLCDPHDVVLVPNPGYPVFGIGPMIGGCEIMTYPLYEKNGWLIDFDDIDEIAAKKAKLMVVSYPSNPVCRIGTDEFYERLIAFAKKYNIVILHDNAYSDIVFGGRRGRSFLSYEGAMDVGVEFYSLSKSYNLTGARILFALGNEAIIEKFRMLRSQIDYGIFYPVQYAAMAALNGPEQPVLEQCREYERRNTALCEGLSKIGWMVEKSEGTMFVWAKLPKGYTSSEAFAIKLMEETGVIVVPGISFGSLGEGYVRFALVHDMLSIQKMIELIESSGLIE